MLIVRLALIFATLILFVALVKVVVTLAIVLAVTVVAVLAVRYVRTFVSAALAARHRPVTPLERRNVRIVGP